MLVCQPTRSALKELAHLVRTLKGEMRSRLAVAILVVSDDDPDAVELDRFEGVFVGEVIADVDRQQGACRVDTVANPGQRGALVPVEVGPKLDEHASAGHPQACSLSEFMCRRDDLADVILGDLAVVHGDGEALVLDTHSRNLCQDLAQFGGRPLEDGYEYGGLFVLVICAVRSGQLEPVAARVPDSRGVDTGADVREIATAQDRHGTYRRDEVERLGGAVDEPGGTWIRNDGGQRSVVVQEHHRLPGARDADQLTVRRQRIRQFRDPPVTGANGDVGQVGEHDVGTAARQDRRHVPRRRCR